MCCTVIMDVAALTRTRDVTEPDIMRTAPLNGLHHYPSFSCPIFTSLGAVVLTYGLLLLLLHLVAT